MIVDALGNPLALRLTGGQVHDITQAEALAAEVLPQALLGDKGYDAGPFIKSLEVRAIKPVIPPKSNRKTKRDCNFALYAERNLIERFFQFIKQFRGIATRYEKTARNFLAGLHFVCALAWLKSGSRPSYNCGVIVPGQYLGVKAGLADRAHSFPLFSSIKRDLSRSSPSHPS